MSDARTVGIKLRQIHRKARYSRTMARLGVLDYLQRGIVYSCVGMCVYAVTMSVLVHRDTMKRGQGA